MRLWTFWAASPEGSTVHRLPPIKVNVTGLGSSLEMESRAWVGLPFTSLTPKISELGKVAEALTANVGALTSSAAGLAGFCNYSFVLVVVAPQKDRCGK